MISEREYVDARFSCVMEILEKAGTYYEKRCTCEALHLNFTNRQKNSGSIRHMPPYGTTVFVFIR